MKDLGMELINNIIISFTNAYVKKTRTLCDLKYMATGTFMFCIKSMDVANSIASQTASGACFSKAPETFRTHEAIFI